MESELRKIWYKDKSRNSKRSSVYLWCYRSSLSKSRLSVTKVIARIALEFYRILGMGILTKNIGGGFRLPHLNGIYIHNNATIGENCIVYQQVTIGVNEHKNNFMAAPKIGNRVYIGAGAKIIGGIVVGDDVRIGANAVVTKNVPDGMTVIGYNKIIDAKPERDGVY